MGFATASFAGSFVGRQNAKTHLIRLTVNRASISSLSDDAIAIVSCRCWWRFDAVSVFCPFCVSQAWGQSSASGHAACQRWQLSSSFAASLLLPYKAKGLCDSGRSILRSARLWHLFVLLDCFRIFPSGSLLRAPLRTRRNKVSCYCFVCQSRGTEGCVWEHRT